MSGSCGMSAFNTEPISSGVRAGSADDGSGEAVDRCRLKSPKFAKTLIDLARWRPSIAGPDCQRDVADPTMASHQVYWLVP